MARALQHRSGLLGVGSDLMAIVRRLARYLGIAILAVLFLVAIGLGVLLLWVTPVAMPTPPVATAGGQVQVAIDPRPALITRTRTPTRKADSA